MAGKVAKRAGKRSKSAAKAGGRKKKRVESYNTYINRVLKQVHPKITISKKSMAIMNSFVNDTFDKVASEAGKLAKATGRKTLYSSDVQTALRLVLPDDLARVSDLLGRRLLARVSDVRLADPVSYTRQAARDAAWSGF